VFLSSVIDKMNSDIFLSKLRKKSESF